MSAAPRRLLVIGDSDSYVKWAAAFATRAPADWETEAVVLASPVLPSERQLAAALAGSRFGLDEVSVLRLEQLTAHIEASRPDAVMLALRGPMVRVVVREIGRSANRPILLSGFPGITIPAMPRAIVYREQVDVIVLQSRREVREYRANADLMPTSVDFALATFPIFETGPCERPVPEAERRDVVFAVQAKVPARRAQRLKLVRMLIDAARAQPEHRIVVKVRARAGEAQTHPERFELAGLITSPPEGTDFGGEVPDNLVIEDGPMADHLRTAVALVTVSSTAVLEAVAAGVPSLLLDDFGVGALQINEVFTGSGLFGDRDDLVEGRYRMPDADWMEDNYFHAADADDWIPKLEALMRRRDLAPLPLARQQHNLAGGALRRAFDRRRVMGEYDTSRLGDVAVLVARPILACLRGIRAVHRSITGRDVPGERELPASVRNARAQARAEAKIRAAARAEEKADAKADAAAAALAAADAANAEAEAAIEDADVAAARV